MGTRSTTDSDSWHDGPFGWNPHALLLVIVLVAPFVVLFGQLAWVLITWVI